MTTIEIKNCLEQTIDIPEGTVFIKLVNCPRLTRVSFPDSIKRIFCKNCKRLDNIFLPNSIESVCFIDCFSLSRIKLNEGLLRIDHQGFKGCPNLKSIYVPSSVVEFGKYDEIYDTDDADGCFERTTEVKFVEDTPSVDIAIENERLKRLVKKYKTLLGVGESQSENLGEPQSNTSQKSWYDDSCYDFYKKECYELISEENYRTKIEELKKLSQAKSTSPKTSSPKTSSPKTSSPKKSTKPPVQKKTSEPEEEEEHFNW